MLSRTLYNLLLLPLAAGLHSSKLLLLLVDTTVYILPQVSVERTRIDE
jgi:hypothetical protein